MPDGPDGGRAISFGPFRLFAEERLLLEGDRPVRLGSRALDILIALAQRPGELISKRELINLVWPDTFVEEGNLKFQISALRRALGDGQAGNRYILNTPGRGYRFLAPVSVTDQPRQPAPQRGSAVARSNLPARLTRLIGRGEIVRSLAEQLHSQRLLTIIGPSGIGKTAVALVVAEELIPNYADGVWLIDLGPLTDPRFVPSALAAALQLAIRSDDPIPDIIAALRDKQLLLVLDNCEHVIDAAAALAEGVLRRAPGVAVLATSREPLRVHGERVYRMPPLASPPASVPLSAGEALQFPAVQLFVERATAALSEFVLTDADAASAGAICRRLDGIALAIEFAAARIEAFVVRGLAAGLDDRLRLLTAGRRVALPRHQTINATLDWSYRLLSEEEQTVFRRLAVFSGGFTLEAAGAMATGTDTAAFGTADLIDSLVMKSLITASVGNGEVRFRQLETTRVFALAKLAESDDENAIRQRHAQYYQNLLESTPSGTTEAEFSRANAVELDNIRAALTWAFAPEGDALISVALTAASAPIWFEMALLAECHGWMGKALAVINPTDRGTRREMLIQTGFGLSLLFTQGMKSGARAALMRASDLAESLRDLDFQLRTLTGLAIFCRMSDDLRGGLVLSRRAEAIARDMPDPVAIATADCLLSSSLFWCGEFPAALTYAQQAIRQSTPVVRRTHIVRSGYDHLVHSRVTVAQVLWLQGRLDQSQQAAREVLADAEADSHPVSLCYALTWVGCTISLKLGDLETAAHSITRLKDHAEKHASSSYYAGALGFEGQLSVKRGDLATGERLLRTSLVGLRQAQYQMLYTEFLGDLAEVLMISGQLDEGLAAADEAVQRIERSGGLWWLPEALRIKGEVQSLSDNSLITAAADNFRQSLDLAQSQGALLWELRSAMALGRLYDTQGRTHDASSLLGSVYQRFTEGFDAPDLQSAKRLLEDWGSATSN